MTSLPTASPVASEGTRAPPARFLCKVAGTLVVVTPLLIASLTLARQLHDRPTGRMPIEVVDLVADDALPAGRSWHIVLPASRWRTRAISLWTSSREPAVTIDAQLCTPTACERASTAADPISELVLRVPEGDLAQLELTVLHTSKSTRLRGGPGSPIEALQGFSWTLPFQRARAYAVAMSGFDLLPVALFLWATMLYCLLVMALLSSWRGAVRPHAPDPPGEKIQRR